MLDAVLGAGIVGVAVFDADLRYVEINEELARINGHPAADHLGRTPMEVLGEEQTAGLLPLLRQAQDGEDVRDLRVEAGPGGTFRVSFIGLPDRHVAAVVVGDAVLGGLALRAEEERLRLTLAGTQAGTWEWVLDTGHVRWSREMGPLFGLEAGFQPGTVETVLELTAPEDREALGALLQRTVAEGESFVRDFRVNAPGPPRWLEGRAAAVRADDGGAVRAVVGIAFDATPRRRREQRADYLSRATAALAETLDPAETLQRLAVAAVPALADWCSVHLAGPDGAIERLEVAHADPSKVELARELETRFPPDPDAAAGMPAVLRTGQPELFREIPEALLVDTAQDAEHLRLLRELDLQSAMVVPLVARGATLGAMTFVAAESGRAFDEEDLEVAVELGRRAGLALDNAALHHRQEAALGELAELYATTRDVAVTLQRSLLPAQLPDVPGVELAWRYVPGQEGAEVGGDWYDAVELPDGRLVLVVGDVMGRGLGAAALMGRLRSALRAYAFAADDAAAALEALDRLTYGVGDVEFATVVLAMLSADRNQMHICRAGHPPPLLVPADGPARLLDVPCGLPLGAPPRARHCYAVDVEHGARLVLYTDGLVERRTETLTSQLAALQAAADAAPDGCDALAEHLLAAMEDGGQHDDVALLAVCIPAD